MFSCATSSSNSSPVTGLGWNRLQNLSVTTSLTHKSDLSVTTSLTHLLPTSDLHCLHPFQKTTSFYIHRHILCIPNVKNKNHWPTPMQWNSLPSDICHIQSSHAFKTSLESCLCKYQKLFQILPSLDLSQQSRNAYPLSKTVHLPCQ